jgi:peroxiredoxin
VLILALLLFPLATFAATPPVGSKAPNFMLSTPNGKVVHLSQLVGKHPLVLVVLRVYPGYQCPYCQRQVHDFVLHAVAFAARRVNVLLIYPGPPADLGQRAKEFLAAEPRLPSNLVLVTDP